MKENTLDITQNNKFVLVRERGKTLEGVGEGNNGPFHAVAPFYWKEFDTVTDTTQYLVKNPDALKGRYGVAKVKDVIPAVWDEVYVIQLSKDHFCRWYQHPWYPNPLWTSQISRAFQFDSKRDADAWQKEHAKHGRVVTLRQAIAAHGAEGVWADEYSGPVIPGPEPKVDWLEVVKDVIPKYEHFVIQRENGDMFKHVDDTGMADLHIWTRKEDEARLFEKQFEAANFMVLNQVFGTTKPLKEALVYIRLLESEERFGKDEGKAEPDPNINENPGYHFNKIQKGVYGEPSKIYEEVAEFADALYQNNPVMALHELSDVLGAIEGYLQTEYDGKFTIQDLYTQMEATKRAFQVGERT